MEALIDRFGYDFITSFHVDLNPFFMHNAFPKITLAFNALKNAVLATDSRYAHYFMDSLSAYARQSTPYHQTVQEPVEDGISPHFALRVPHVVVSYMSLLGCTQEDADEFVLFHPVQGDPDETSLVGTVVHYGESPLQVEPFSIHVCATPVTDQVIHLHFTKPPFRVIQHHLSINTLSICLEQDHLASTGDKLCSFHGQKGVLRLIKSLPLLDESIQPELLVNPYSLFRMTPGQILEGLARGQGKDAQTARNTEGQVVPHAKAFY
ncbi:RNA_pol_Rpb2_6 domain-containing protein, partial [Nephila pilipes]